MSQFQNDVLRVLASITQLIVGQAAGGWAWAGERRRQRWRHRSLRQRERHSWSPRGIFGLGFSADPLLSPFSTATAPDRADPSLPSPKITQNGMFPRQLTAARAPLTLPAQSDKLSPEEIEEYKAAFAVFVRC